MALLARAMSNTSQAKHARGELAPLERDPVTGKRPQGTGRYPTTGVMSPLIQTDALVPRVSQEGRFRSKRERANALRQRMNAFSAIYNAAYIVRDAYFSSDHRRHEAVMQLVAALLQELRATQDYEACIFAIADALYASPLGVPWEP